VHRFLAFMIVATIVWSQSVCLAASICHHRSAQEHALARASADPRTAASALNEEAADRTAKKLGLSGSASVWLADFVLPSTIGPALLSNETMAPHFGPISTLAGRAIPPPLRPPFA